MKFCYYKKEIFFNMNKIRFLMRENDFSNIKKSPKFILILKILLLI